MPQWYSSLKGEQDQLQRNATEQPRIEQPPIHRINPFPSMPQAGEARFGPTAIFSHASQPPETIRHTPSGPYPETRPDIRPNSVANDSFSQTNPSFEQPRKSVEETPQARRPYFGPHLDSGRMERGSPLPQAIQGAQGQPASSGRDPSVKSEFGRMFSGLGSGVGGTPQPVAAQNSAKNSTVVEDVDLDQTARKPKGDGNRGKQLNDEEGGVGSESGDEMNIPSGSAPDGKRAKLGQSAHYHHHHHSHL